MGRVRDTEKMLEQWGLWVVQGSGVANYASQGSQPTAMITDDEALRIDRLCAGDLALLHQRRVVCSGRQASRFRRGENSAALEGGGSVGRWSA